MRNATRMQCCSGCVAADAMLQLLRGSAARRRCKRCGFQSYHDREGMMDERSKEFASLPSAAAAACVIFNMFLCVCVYIYIIYIYTLPSGMYACKRAYRVAQCAWQQQQQQQQQQPFPSAQSPQIRRTNSMFWNICLNNRDSQ